LKTPLTSIKGYLETLQNGAKNDPEILNRFLNRIDVNVGRLVELVQEILSLARVEAQGGTLRRMAVDLANVARESLVQHEHAVTEKNIDLQVQMDESIVVHGDREAVRQVIDNLLGNAIKYTPDGGGVTFGIKKEQNYAVLTVTDTGVGIPSEHHGRIFERFYRVDKHRNREDGGTGLGLSIVKHLVHSMHGKISVDSTVGRGSTFQVQMHLHR
jgi:two-component system phosphate regulon sensor histidine kinase PhoR